MSWRVSGPCKAVRQVAPDEFRINELGQTVVEVEDAELAIKLAALLVTVARDLGMTRGSVSIRRVADGEGGA